jgi:hypothetical protein
VSQYANERLRSAGKKKSAIWEEEDEELWGGAAPKMEISYDAANGFLLTGVPPRGAPLALRALLSWGRA